MDRLLTYLCLFLACAHFAAAGKKKVAVKPACVFTADFSMTEMALRSAILKGDVHLAAKILKRDEPWALAAGLRYSPKEQCFLEKTTDRASDPDIVAIKALALNVEWTHDAAKMARVTVQSFTTPCRCPSAGPKVFDQMEKDFRALFADPEERRFILDYGRPTGRHAPTDGHRRLLATDSSPTDSFVCAHCDPRRSCRPCHWCN